MGMDAGGARVKPKVEMSNSAALQELNVRERPQANGETLVITSIKLHDPVKAIAELNKMEQVYDISPKVNIPIQINYVLATQENAAELQRKMQENRERQ